MKKTVYIALCTMIACGCKIPSAYGGETSDPLTWSLDNGTLTISGTGAMPDYDYDDKDDRPWHSYRDNITMVNIKHGVTNIGDLAFYTCSSLTSITIPNSVTTIGDAAFGGCFSLTSITIPNSVTTIGDLAFYACHSLTSITIGNSVTNIGSEAFAQCGSLQNVAALRTRPPALGDDAFDEVPLTSATLTVPKGSKSAYQSAGGWNEFGTLAEEPTSEQTGLRWLLDNGTLIISGTGAMPDFDYGDEDDRPWHSDRDNITRVVIQSGVTSIGRLAFDGCSNLTSITIPNSATTIGERAFAHCSSLTSITIPNSVTTIGIGAFGGCGSLTSITIGNSVTTIGDGAFLGCSSLTSITIPNSVRTIGWRAFLFCGNLENVVVLKTTPPALGDDTFDEVPLSSATLTVPYGSRSAYQSAAGWGSFRTIIEMNN